MKAIIIDDEPLMLRKFIRLSSDIPDLNITGQFESAENALKFLEKNKIDAAFIDVSLPKINGITFAQMLREKDPNILVIFVTAYDKYIWEFNQIGGDYYILKPYTRETLLMAMDRIRLLAHRRHKELYVQMFGRFTIFKNDCPLPLTGKAKEILALIMTKRGKEISNEEIYTTIWEFRPYSNDEMSVYYNALKRLKNSLQNLSIEGLLISTKRGQLVNTKMFDCDYYAWLDKNSESRDRFEGEFLTEYSWGEDILANMIYRD